LSKYEYLNPKKAKQILETWKTALEKAQCTLGKLEQEVVDDTKLSDRIRSIFDLKENESAILYKPNNDKNVLGMRVQVEIKCDESTLEKISIIAQFIKNNFQKNTAVKREISLPQGGTKSTARSDGYARGRGYKIDQVKQNCTLFSVQVKLKSNGDERIVI